MRELILASTSPARRALMDALKVPYRAEAPGVDEELEPGIPVEEAVRRLAHRKATAVLARHPEAVVVGADQLAAVGEERLGKPADRAAARAQLVRLRERPHRLVTGVCVLAPGFHLEEVDVATLGFYPVPDEELERYLELEEWRGCAGGYRIEEAGGALVESLEGDRTSVQGLPMLRLVRMLRSAGVRFFEGPGRR